MSSAIQDRMSPDWEAVHLEVLHQHKDGVIYIAGPMTGYVDFNFPAFDWAELLLRQEGCTDIINPATNFDRDQSLPRMTYLRKAVCQVAGADSMLFLPGWVGSEGAWMEFDIANHLSLPRFFAIDLWPEQEPNLQGERDPSMVAP